MSIEDKIETIMNKVSFWLKKRSGRFWDFIKLNFTDRAGRVDTGRIGQILGLTFLSIITIYSTVMVLMGKHIPFNKVLLGSIAAAFPMMLYRMKEFSGLQGTAYSYEPKEDRKFFLKTRDFFKKNFTDEWGRVNTGRLGQFLGLIIMTIMSVFIIYVYIFHSLLYPGAAPIEVDTEQLLMLGGDSALPMLLYRLKGMSKQAGSMINSYVDPEDDSQGNENE